MQFDSTDESIDAVLARAGRRLVVGIPIGVGKPNYWINALYDRACADSSIDLTILTGLSLDRASTDHLLEQRLWDHVNRRLHPGYPWLRYVEDYRAERLPSNITVSEFFFEPGSYLDNAYAQRHYMSSNYTHVWRDMRDRGVNVIAQAIAPAEAGDRFSFGCNSDVILKLIEEIPREQITVVGELNAGMPYMYGPAEVRPDFFDVIVDEAGHGHQLLSAHAPPLTMADYFIGLYASALVRDGGTLEIGFGATGDAIAQCLLLRHTQNAIYRDLLARIDAFGRYGPLIENLGGAGPFREGLYGASEMMSYGLFRLFTEGVISRLSSENVALKAGFFVGTQGFYEELRALPEQARRRISMSGVDDINQLYGADALRKRRDRAHARYINNAMMVTLLGDVISDALANGRVVSGVGGQYNFVAMAHALDDARSIITIRSTRSGRRGTSSNIVWNYPAATVPRHLRDIVVTEYGIADVRGQDDQTTVSRLLAIAHPDFRPSLLRDARLAGKTGQQDVVSSGPGADELEAIFSEARSAGYFPEFPFGTDFTAPEIDAARALHRLRDSRSVSGAMRLLASRPASGSAERRAAALDVLGLKTGRGFRNRYWRLLIERLL